MESLLQNLRFALRQLRKSPGFTLTVVITLALGIGANTAVFTLFDQVLMRMLPVERPEELVRFVWSGSFAGSSSSFGGDMTNFFSYPMYKDLRDQNQVFSGMLAADRLSAGVSWHNQASDEDVELVTGNYFELLGLRPTMGRLFTMQDETAKNANPVLVLSYDYWRTRFAASHDVIGQTVQINGHPFTVVGIAPENFDSAIGGYKPKLFLPITMVDEVMPQFAVATPLTSHQTIWLTLAARRKPGVSIARAEAAMGPLWHALRASELTAYKDSSARFKKRFLDDSTLKVVDDSTGFSPGRMDLKTPLVLLMSMAGLLVAMCAINVATLLLLRASGRAREMSLRYALGAKRGRIIAQLLLEGGVLGAAGGLAGLGMVPVVANVLVRILTNADPGEEPYSAAIDGRVLLFALGVSLVASLLFSVAPVLHFMRPDLAMALRQNAGTASKSSQRFRKIAVGAQIGLSVLLLGGAGLFVRTLDNLRHQAVGFDTSHLVTFGLDPTDSGYGEDRAEGVIRSALDVVRAIPGVTAVAATTDGELMSSENFTDFAVQGHKATEDESMNFEEPWITPGYFAALKQPLLRGREFTEGDVAKSAKVAIVNMVFAKRFYGSAENALGHMVSGNGLKTLDTTIVGVVGDAKHKDLRTDPGPTVYRAYAQADQAVGVKMYVRTSQSPELVESSIRQAIHQLDPALVVDGLRTMEEQVDRSASNERALAMLAIAFSALALVLAAVGLYGVLAYSTEQRTREIGVRLALGAQRSGVVLLVLKEMSLIAAVAVVVALPSIVAVAQLFRSQLYGVGVNDPVTLAVAVGGAAVMVALASVLPARRAASVEPMKALRTD